MEALKQSISRAQESHIEAAMDILVDEIFQRYSNNQEELTFEEWQQWFLNLEGMKEVLDMKPHGATNTHKAANSSK